MIVQGLAHHREAEGCAFLARDGGFPVLEITLHDVDHVTDQVTRLPAGTARVDVPVLRIRDEAREVFAVTAHDAHDRVLAFSRHRVDRSDGCRAAHKLIPLPEAKFRPRAVLYPSVLRANRRRGRYDDRR